MDAYIPTTGTFNEDKAIVTPRQILNRRMEVMLAVVFSNLKQLFPKLYSVTWPYYLKQRKAGGGTIQLNIHDDHKRELNILMYSTGIEYYDVAIPYICWAMVQILTKSCKLNEEELKVVYDRLVEATYDKLTCGTPPSMRD